MVFLDMWQNMFFKIYLSGRGGEGVKYMVTVREKNLLDREKETF